MLLYSTNSYYFQGVNKKDVLSPPVLEEQFLAEILSFFSHGQVI